MYHVSFSAQLIETTLAFVVIIFTIGASRTAFEEVCLAKKLLSFDANKKRLI